MKSFRSSRPTEIRGRPRSGPGFTLVEVLASLLLMAIIIPVAMEGLSVASRVGVLGQRKAAAMRVGERVLNELIVEQQTQQNSASGTAYDRDTAYPWTMRVENWTADAMQQMTVAVSFTVQGSTYEVAVTTLLPVPAGAEDPLAAAVAGTQ